METATRRHIQGAFATPSLVANVRDILIKDAECVSIDTRVTSNMFSDTVSLVATDDSNELLFCHFMDRLIIKRVLIKRPKQGTFSKIMECMLTQVDEAEIKEIVIESVITEEMRDWCLKREFSVPKYCVVGFDGLGVDYKITPRLLKATLSTPSR